MSNRFRCHLLVSLIDQKQGYSGEELLVAFRETRAQVRPAVEAMLKEAERAATQPDQYASYADVFGAEGDE